MQGTSPEPPRYWTEAELQTSIQGALAGWQAGGLWLFAYGSLMWSPGFKFLEQSPAKVFGYHRSFCLRSRVNRGTPENPGLVLGLDRGGSCQGIAFQLAPPPSRGKPPAASDALGETLSELWHREMLTGAYHPRWLTCKLPNRNVRALAYVINREASGYCGRLDFASQVAAFQTASGRFGTAADYLFNTVASLKRLGIEDRGMQALARAVGVTTGLG